MCRHGGVSVCNASYSLLSYLPTVVVMDTVLRQLTDLCDGDGLCTFLYCLCSYPVHTFALFVIQKSLKFGRAFPVLRSFRVLPWVAFWFQS